MSDSSDFESEPEDSPWGQDFSITDPTRVIMTRTVRPGTFSYRLYQPLFDLGWEIKQKYNKFLAEEKKKALAATDKPDSDDENEMDSDGEGTSGDVDDDGQGTSAPVAPKVKKPEVPKEPKEPEDVQNDVDQRETMSPDDIQNFDAISVNSDTYVYSSRRPPVADMDLEEVMELEDSSDDDEEPELIMEPRDWIDVTPNGTEARNRLERLILKFMLTGGHRRKSYIRFLEIHVAKMEKILHLYKSDYHFKLLRKEDSASLWSQERMTEAEHERHFTRWNAAMMNAKKAIFKRDIAKAKRGGLIGISATEAEFCRNDVIAMAEELDKKRKDEYMEWFTLKKFSLADALERKWDDSGNLFNKSMMYMTDYQKVKKDDVHVHRMYAKSRAAKPLAAVLKRNGLNYKTISEELTRGLRPRYTLPKGKLYCRLILNIASLAHFDVKEDAWACMKYENDEDYEKWIFRGIPFDSNGNPYTFQTVATDPSAPSTSKH